MELFLPFCFRHLNDVRNHKRHSKGNTAYTRVKGVYYDFEKGFGRALRRTSASYIMDTVDILTGDV
jgi:hypothetical protein